MKESGIGTTEAGGHSRDFQLMLARIIHRHSKGLDLTDTIAGARDLLARKGSLSPLRDDEPEAPPQSSPSQTPVDPQKAVKAFRTAALAAIQDLRHAAACNFSQAYSGSLGEARCNSFYEAYEAVRKLAPSDAPSTPEPRR